MIDYLPPNIISAVLIVGTAAHRPGKGLFSSIIITVMMMPNIPIKENKFLK